MVTPIWTYRVYNETTTVSVVAGGLLRPPKTSTPEPEFVRPDFSHLFRGYPQASQKFRVCARLLEFWETLGLLLACN